MQLTKEQIDFLNEVCVEMKVTYSLRYDKSYQFKCKSNWNLNSDGEVDVYGVVILKNSKISEIPVKFGKIDGNFYCDSANLTTLKNFPKIITPDPLFNIMGNRLTNYFKNIKEEDFIYWDKLVWWDVLREYPFLINIGKKYLDNDDLKNWLRVYPQTKLYLK